MNAMGNVRICEFAEKLCYYSSVLNDAVLCNRTRRYGCIHRSSEVRCENCGTVKTLVQGSRVLHCPHCADRSKVRTVFRGD